MSDYKIRQHFRKIGRELFGLKLAKIALLLFACFFIYEMVMQSWYRSQCQERCEGEGYHSSRYIYDSAFVGKYDSEEACYCLTHIEYLDGAAGTRID